MAILFLGASRCSICKELLVQGQTIIATTHFIADTADPLWRFSDSGMHEACFAGWEHRNEFAARYHTALGRSLAGWVPAVPANPDAPTLPKLRLTVMGESEEREEFFEALQDQVTQGAEPAAAPDT